MTTVVQAGTGRDLKQRLVETLSSITISAWVALAVIFIYAVLGIFAPLIAPHGEDQIVSDSSYAPWSAQLPLGTDQLGRDMLTRLIYGARNSVGLAFTTTCLSFAMGGVLGIVAAVRRGWLDEGLSRLFDTLMAIPQLIFALILLTIFGSSILNLVLIISILDSTRIFRLARSVAMNVVVMDFIEIARLRSEKLPWIVFREILPNIRTTLIAEFGVRFCYVFLTISALSFLGLGIQPPTADWGSMVRENAALIAYADITPLLPAAAIAILTVSVNVVVDWLLQDASELRNER